MFFLCSYSNLVDRLFVLMAQMAQIISKPSCLARPPGRGTAQKFAEWGEMGQLSTWGFDLKNESNQVTNIRKDKKF